MVHGCLELEKKIPERVGDLIWNKHHVITRNTSDFIISRMSEGDGALVLLLATSRSGAYLGEDFPYNQKVTAQRHKIKG